MNRNASRLLSRVVNANIFPLLSALWLVDDSAAVSLRYVLTRDRMMSFRKFSVSSSVVDPAVYPVFSWLLRVQSCTSAHLKPWTAQDVITPCSSHSCLTDLNSFVCCGKPSEVVPSFPLGSGASCLVRRGRCSLDSALMCISLEMRRDCSGKIISSRKQWSGDW